MKISEQLHSRCDVPENEDGLSLGKLEAGICFLLQCLLVFFYGQLEAKS